MKNNKAVSPDAVYQMAVQIYQTWRESGTGALKQLFIQTLSIPDALATRFAENYKPVNPPVQDITVTDETTGSAIFGSLALQFADESGYGSIWPKNVLGWWVLRHVYGAKLFDFDIIGTSSATSENTIHYPAHFCNAGGNNVSPGYVAIGAVEFEHMPQHVVRKINRLGRSLPDNVAADLVQALLDAQIVFPPKQQIDLLVQAIERGLKGEEVVLTGIICPDYGYEEVKGGDVPFRYTFDSVSGGVGLVAQQVVRVLPFLVEFFKKHDIAHKIKVAIADFEANSDEILKRVQLTKLAFVDLCRHALTAFSDALPGIPMDLVLFEEQWANGRMVPYQQEALENMQAGNFGDTRLYSGKNPLHEIKAIAGGSERFFQDWYGRSMGLSEIETIVMTQAAEYAACGRIMAMDFGSQPFIQIAGDSPKKQIFNNMYSAHPTLCTKRVY